MGKDSKPPIEVKKDVDTGIYRRVTVSVDQEWHEQEERLKRGEQAVVWAPILSGTQSFREILDELEQKAVKTLEDNDVGVEWYWPIKRGERTMARILCQLWPNLPPEDSRDEVWDAYCVLDLLASYHQMNIHLAPGQYPDAPPPIDYPPSTENFAEVCFLLGWSAGRMRVRRFEPAVRRQRKQLQRQREGQRAKKERDMQPVIEAFYRINDIKTMTFNKIATNIRAMLSETTKDVPSIPSIKRYLKADKDIKRILEGYEII